jgi:putative Mg2+ transporter-C (MgtC) family protein
MALEITWQDIALRLLLTVIGGALIGLNREEQGRPAGLRTTMLVSLAAAISMVQVNLLLGVVGKAHDSFVVLDLMRLPLGILSGMGFIGAGAILKKGNLVHGVTTAATLWFVTTMGLCFGGGQLCLGLAALILGLIVLAVLRLLEKRLKQHRHATLTIMVGETNASGAEILNAITQAGYRINSSSVALGPSARLAELTCDVSWLACGPDLPPISFLKVFSARFDLLRTDWRVEN